jgi:hypothetical protein
MNDSDPPTPQIGGPTSASWREEALARAEGLKFLKDWIRNHPTGPSVDGGDASIAWHLDAAHDAAHRPRILRPWRVVTESPVERALANLDMAEVDLLRLCKGAATTDAAGSIVLGRSQAVSGFATVAA